MKITTLIGWRKKTESGMPVGEPSVISCIDLDGDDRRAQSKAFTDAKGLHIYPKGFKVLGYLNSDFAGIELASFVSEEAAAVTQASIRNQHNAEAKIRQNAAAKEKRKQDLAEAHKNIGRAAVKLDAKRQALHLAKRSLSDAEANAKSVGTEEFKSKIPAAQQKVTAAEKEVTEAQSELASAKKAKADLKNPQPETPVASGAATAPA